MSNIIDSHTHPLPELITPESMIEEMNKSNIGKAVVLSMKLNPDITKSKVFRKKLDTALRYSFIYDLETIISGMKFTLEIGNTTNKAVLDFVEGHRDRFIPFGSVNPVEKKKIIKKDLEIIASYGFTGIKMLPTLQFFNPSKEMKKLSLIFKFARKHDLILMFHTGCDPGPWELPVLSTEANPNLLEPIISKFQDNRVIIAHMGSYSAKNPGIWFEEALALLDYPHVYGDLSAVPYLVEQEKFVNKIRENDVFEKILWGSDYPVITGSSIKDSYDIVDKSPLLTKEEKINLTERNAQKLFFK